MEECLIEDKHQINLCLDKYLNSKNLNHLNRKLSMMISTDLDNGEWAK